MPDIPPVHNTYLAFFHLEQTNAIAQQLQVLLCTFAGNLGSHELPVEGGIIVILVRSQIHLVELTWVTVLTWAVWASVVVLSVLVLAVVHHLLLIGLHCDFN